MVEDKLKKIIQKQTDLNLIALKHLRKINSAFGGNPIIKMMIEDAFYEMKAKLEE